jgi:nitrate reductase beta subunit
MLFSYKIAYKIATRYTPYQLVYRVHPLMPTEYIVPVAGGNERDNILVKILSSRITYLEKLQEVKM